MCPTPELQQPRAMNAAAALRRLHQEIEAALEVPPPPFPFPVLTGQVSSLPSY
jgi:hypothetical protein